MTASLPAPAPVPGAEVAERPDGGDGAGAGMGPAMTGLFALATGLIVANVYYAQPLLDLIAGQLQVTEAAAALIVTVSQVSFAAGLALVVPVGDLVNRRPLVVVMLAISSAGLVAVALAPNLPVVLLALSVVGATTVVAQILVPLAATLAADGQRGRVVGTVMSGLLLGILLARTIAGIVAGAFGWRAIYAVAAVVTALLALVLARALPARTPTVTGDYRSILRSLVGLARAHRQLRVRAAYGAAGFAAFSIFWTTASFRLASPPYGYSPTVIGLFGLIGAAGALSASGAGRLADRGWVRVPTGILGAGLTASFGLLALGDSSVVAFIAGVIVLDIAAQGLHILNQNVIFALDPEARSRLNSIYMTTYFLVGALSSLVAAWCYTRLGWSAVCGLGALTGIAASLIWLLPDRPRTRDSATAS
jgi:predicted MFS family arabinose efflux permease